MAQLPSVGHEQFYSILAANDDLVFMHVDEPGGEWDRVARDGDGDGDRDTSRGFGDNWKHLRERVGAAAPRRKGLLIKASLISGLRFAVHGGP